MLIFHLSHFKSNKMIALFLLLLFNLLSQYIYAQAPPDAFNYSGSARDAGGNPISERTIGVELSILKSSSNGTVQYRERHFVITDKFGVFNCAVGQGSVQQGTFSTIEWSNDNYFLRVGLDANGGNNFELLGSPQLLSVPYALFARRSTPTVINAGNNVAITGQGTTSSPYVISASVSTNGGYTGAPIFTVGNGVTDIDGNTYKTVKIGTQEWMAENLKVTRYRNGNPVPNVTNNTEWSGLTTGAWCYYNNDTTNNAIYGKLYNWHAVVDNQRICPTGWHVPTDVEWTSLMNFIDPIGPGGDGSAFAGGMMKSTGTLQTRDGLWQHPNPEASNGSGFSGIPGGRRMQNGTFELFGYYGYWWSSSQHSITGGGWARNLSNGNTSLFRNRWNKGIGFSVRCIKD